ncbi:dual OB domain-containing protein [Desulfomicrobium orale]|mgnify:CR=1 FL=1|uniref:dual OB domain-containing protein n=1 Tax=Desulfomicrobium orale TaxID=132132 RepID=UPI0009F8505F|nr:hypothetical protein [Desulfomicrobium orale]
MFRRTIVILANSIKHKKHCVAGKCVSTKKWIRPVSDETGGALSRSQVAYQNPYGIFIAKPLQKISIGLLRQVPLLHQPENYLIDNSVWTQNFNIPYTGLSQFLDNPSDLWGTSDRVEYLSIDYGLVQIIQSLYLVVVNNLVFYKNINNKRRASFTYKENIYDLAVTDPNFDSHENNQYRSKVICVSLGSVYKGFCYKLVVAIF